MQRARQSAGMGTYELYDTDSGPSLEPQQSSPTPRSRTQTGSHGQSSSAATQTQLHHSAASFARASVAAPPTVVGPPKHPEQVAQAKGMDAANVALQSLCFSPYDSPPHERASAPSPRSGPPKAAAEPLSPRDFGTTSTNPHDQGPDPFSTSLPVRSSPPQSPIHPSTRDSPPSPTPTPSAPWDNSLPPSPTISEHNAPRPTGSHTLSPAPSPAPSSPPLSAMNQPSFSQNLPPSSPLPSSPLEGVARRKSSFSFPFSQVHPAAPTPHPSPPVTPPLHSAGISRTAFGTESKPTFFHQGPQVWVNTEEASDGMLSQSPSQELHAGKGTDGGVRAARATKQQDSREAAQFQGEA
ncbi:hypothetical protein DUNSADRAFT_10416 [Dunaliella salina]|uniref:Uncharacterized protein n=1 Tax=Dunaliella salina TaxID=3046 RepID=A0ABQ7GFG0_DUNSA|nr:hypothetical protein DUNSADRAFT_10416 [Dunaliella salina]|eukprot:KAF5833336.1 hypothetical protein DUNSADRAFT_10416 [Dunaliella salina]